MKYFSERTDALLLNWLSSPAWHSDRPSSNIHFYRFAAALMQEVGQADLREVRSTLEEAGRASAAGYAEHNGDARIGVLCERMQVLYDFFNALQEPTSQTFTSPLLSSPHRQPPLPSPPIPSTDSTTPEKIDRSDAVSSRQKPPRTSPLLAKIATAPKPAPPQTAPPPSTIEPQPSDVLSTPKNRGRRGREVLVEQTEDNRDGPSSERWQAFWRMVLGLYDLLVARRGETHPAPPPQNDPEAVASEMQRRAHEVLYAEEITGVEKRDLIGTIINKVMPHRKDDDVIYVEIEWLR